MPSAHDVARYILERLGEMTAMKLQKLLYYCQAWNLVWEETPLFGEGIQAWSNGPVIREIYDLHKREFKVSEWPWGKTENLSQKHRDTIDGVLDFYGGKSAQWLSDLTHREAPWNEARKGYGDGERSEEEITLASMHEYYSSLK